MKDILTKLHPLQLVRCIRKNMKLINVHLVKVLKFIIRAADDEETKDSVVVVGG